jgi:RHS repeat-associated protein
MGRTQDWSLSADALVEQAQVDGLGRRLTWRYRTVDLRHNDRPIDPAWGSRYCGGAWDPRCADPLLEIGAVRDVMGRIGSLTWRHGHPVFDGDGDLDLSHDPAQPWRGFAYDGQGQLAREWIHSGQSGIADTTALVNHHLTGADVAAIGQASGAVAWDWVREPGVAGLVSIESPGQASRWATTQARLPGHKLTEVAVDGVTHGIDHDDGGRMTAGAGWEGRYGPEDRLVTAWRTDTGEQEIYLYDALGRLTVILDGDGDMKEGFVHDGAHKVAAFDGEGSPKWEAVWGPGLNRLLEVRDLSGASPVAQVPLLDHRRSVVGVWDGAQERVTALAEYDAKGRPTVLDPHGEATCEEAGTTTVCAGPAGLPFGWKGMWRSEVTGLVQMRARWYDPSLGEFTSPDPLLYIDSNNPYAYAAFDPVNKWDPSGLALHDAAQDRDELSQESDYGVYLVDRQSALPGWGMGGGGGGGRVTLRPPPAPPTRPGMGTADTAVALGGAAALGGVAGYTAPLWQRVLEDNLQVPLIPPSQAREDLPGTVPGHGTPTLPMDPMAPVVTTPSSGPQPISPEQTHLPPRTAEVPGLPIILQSEFGNLKTLSPGRLRDLGVDAEEFKKGEVGARGGEYNIAYDTSTREVFLVPARKGGSVVETGSHLDELPGIAPLE